MKQVTPRGGLEDVPRPCGIRSLSGGLIMSLSVSRLIFCMKVGHNAPESVIYRE